MSQREKITRMGRRVDEEKMFTKSYREILRENDDRKMRVSNNTK